MRSSKAEAGSSLRFHKSERSPLGSAEESVEVFPATNSWTDADGRSGVSPGGPPLDELSFIYFIRTQPLEVGTKAVSRHGPRPVVHADMGVAVDQTGPVTIAVDGL